MDSKDRARDTYTQGVEFERFALAVLRAEAASEGRTLLVGNELPSAIAFADAFAPNGLLGLPGPCFVEVKLRYSERVLYSLEHALSTVPSDASILLVLRDGRYPRERLPEHLAANHPGVTLRVIGREELDELARKHPAAALPFTAGNLNRALTSFRTRTDDSRANEQHITALRSAYYDDRLALFLGAGVSKSADYPDWPQLVRRLAATMFDNHSEAALSEDERLEIQAFFEKEVPASPLIVARLLRNSLGGGFADAVRGALYRGASENVQSTLLNEIGALCMPQRSRIGVQAVVTYNFDDLLEIELQRRGIAFRAVITEGEKALRDELPVYHVHGFLPRGGQLTPIHQSALVLSEDAYHTQFVDPFIWTNLTQLNLLRNSVCLFVGVSMTDPNHRRLLEITALKDASARHYVIMRDHWTGPAARRLSTNGQELARVFKGLEEASLASLGVTVLWVNEFYDVPEVLAAIRR